MPTLAGTSLQTNDTDGEKNTLNVTVKHESIMIT